LQTDVLEYKGDALLPIGKNSTFFRKSVFWVNFRFWILDCGFVESLCSINLRFYNQNKGCRQKSVDVSLQIV